MESMERTMIARFRCLLDNTCGFVVSKEIEYNHSNPNILESRN